MKSLKYLALGLSLVALAGFGVYQYLFAPPEILERVANNKPLEFAPSEFPTSLQVIPSEETADGFPKEVKIEAGDHSFTARYTGQMTRSKNLLVLSIDLYALASYAVDPPKDGDSEAMLDEMFQSGERKLLLLKFLKPLPGKHIFQAVEEEIEISFTDVDLDPLRPNMDQFLAQFANGSMPGDIVYIAWLPGGRLYSSFNEPEDVSLVLEDVPFVRALWRIWFGPQSGPERFGLVSSLTGDTQMK
ncbi:hypothetical protein Pan216_48020 [Planctomycetes bacterium Pan216]|uniref:Chalcone isomerase domain-containing protein n=1 Tax=Kolteria novifilia TaxID=2527975 RepID=A0A518BAB5_9BACT|nr:hypothetical protein Pan216_48020 [Planctomycetes bacterium Pan216]